MGQEGLGPESVPVPGPLHYSPILALLFGREETVITNLKKGQGEETDWQAQRGPVTAQSKLPWLAQSDQCFKAKALPRSRTLLNSWPYVREAWPLLGDCPGCLHPTFCPRILRAQTQIPDQGQGTFHVL